MNEHFLATVLFTDIVGSTDHATTLGDRGWRELLDRHHARVRRQLRTFGGREIGTAGDGIGAEGLELRPQVGERGASRGAAAVVSSLASVAAAALTLAAVHVGCGADPAAPLPSPRPEPPAPVTDSVPLPELRVPAVFTTRVVLTLEDPATGARRVRACAGSLVLRRQDGPALEGDFAVRGSDGCSPADSGRVTGRVFPFGDLVLDLQVPGAAANELPANAGCAYATPPGPFEGAVNDKRFVVLSAARVSCAGDARDLRVRIGGERVFATSNPRRRRWWRRRRGP